MMAKFSSLLILGASLLAGIVSATEAKPATANIEVTAKFPDNPFGLIVNGQRNKVVLEVANKDDTPYTIYSVSGQISQVDDYSKVIRNLTAIRYEQPLAAGAAIQVPYNFYSEYVPGDHGLTVFVNILSGELGSRIVGFNGTITVSDPESSWFDLQLLVLYAILLAGGVGVAFLIRAAFFTETKKTKKTKVAEEPTERATHRDEKGELVLDQSWIPEEHLKLGSPKKNSPKIKKRAARK